MTYLQCLFIYTIAECMRVIESKHSNRHCNVTYFHGGSSYVRTEEEDGIHRRSSACSQ